MQAYLCIDANAEGMGRHSLVSQLHSFCSTNHFQYQHPEELKRSELRNGMGLARETREGVIARLSTKSSLSDRYRHAGIYASFGSINHTFDHIHWYIALSITLPNNTDNTSYYLWHKQPAPSLVTWPRYPAFTLIQSRTSMQMLF